jgi:BolA protein
MADRSYKEEMLTTKEKIEIALREKLKAFFVSVEDESYLHAGHPGVMASGGGHFNVTVVSPVFEGKGLLEQHRLVYEALGPDLEKEIHALSLKTFSPNQWKIS